MKIIKKKISDLNPADYNPRKISKEELNRLKDSIEKFGYVELIVWNKRTGNVISGHQRLKVLQQIGTTEIEVIEVDLDEVQEKALNLAMNKIGGEWDDKLLPELLLKISQENEEMLKYTGFDDMEIFTLLKNVEFNPDLEENQGKLDEKKKVKCPNCGEEFEP